MMMDGMGMMIWGVFSFLLGLLLILIFVVVVVAAVKWLWGQKLPFVVSDRENVLEILKRRYAKGEIGKEEYERIKRISSNYSFLSPLFKTERKFYVE